MRLGFGYRSRIHAQVAAALGTIVVVARYVICKEPAPVLSTAPMYGVPLAVAIFLVMWQRGAHPDKALGYRSLPAPPSFFQANLQNTVEQTLLAVLAAGSFAAVAPAHAHGLLLGAGWLFAAGRLLFFVGYGYAPMWRFYGFALNFYTSAALLLASLWFALM